MTQLRLWGFFKVIHILKCPMFTTEHTARGKHKMQSFNSAAVFKTFFAYVNEWSWSGLGTARVPTIHHSLISAKSKPTSIIFNSGWVVLGGDGHRSEHDIRLRPSWFKFSWKSLTFFLFYLFLMINEGMNKIEAILFNAFIFVHQNIE